MIAIDDVIARIVAAAPALDGRTHGAAELTALIKQNRLPPVTPAAFVLPAELRGAEPDAAAGLYRQGFDQAVSIVLVIEAHGDATGKAALPKVDELVNAIVTGVAGWAPGDQVGVFRLLRGAIVSLDRGAVIYQLDFAIADQLRIAT